ncbi:hypothetical protein DENSPDRAFT_758028, partial [Dentipellis sp. KUC8613]
MSRSMTAAQVIALGEYLDPDFDPAGLTVSQLLGVFGFHNIRYPTPYTKPKLVQLFNDELKPKAAKFKRDRLKKENSIASDDGIKDGVTGRLLSEDKPLRRSSRRSSRAPTQEPEAAPEPPKRRRSSAQPSLGGPSTRVARPSEPALMEESEPEEIPVRKVSRGKKSSEDAGSRARRVSQTREDDSGWEDNNIFQSGAESSSPARPSPVKTRARKSLATRTAAARKSRKATSAPPEMLPPSSPTKGSDDEPPFSPPRSRFAPQLPPDVPRPGSKPPSTRQRLSFQPVEHLPSSPKNEDIQEETASQIHEEADELADDVDPLDTLAEEEELEESESEEAKHNNEVSRRIAQGGVVARRPPPSGSLLASFFRFCVVIFLLVVPYQVYHYKQQSAAIGFCDAGSDTNDVLERARTKFAAIETCNRENRTLLYFPSPSSGPNGTSVDQTPCPALPVFPFHPDSCTPCPEHATCAIEEVTCENGYILQLHPALSWLPIPRTNSLSNPHTQPSAPVVAVFWVSSFLDGLPGFGSVALPPRCMPDPQRKKHIGVLGKAIEAVLGQERGRRVCAGEVPSVKDEAGGEAKRWGMEMGALRKTMKQKTAPQLLDTFDDTFNEAIQQLVHWGGVLTGADTEGHRYIAHKTANLDWHCTLTVKSREAWKEWRGRVLTTVAFVVSMLVMRARRAQRKVEDKRVAELVQVALDMLRNQELAHHTDPVTAPQPYLSSLQLRDLILQDEHSVSRRRRLWDQVERVVEGNANVRVNLEEVHGGDELRVWRWVGGAGR